jgi:hypothetical protein
LMLHADCSTDGGPIQSANASQLPQAQSSNSRRRFGALPLAFECGLGPKRAAMSGPGQNLEELTLSIIGLLCSRKRTSHSVNYEHTPLVQRRSESARRGGDDPKPHPFRWR